MQRTAKEVKLAAAARHEDAFRQELMLAAVMVPLGLWLGQTGGERALLIGSVGIGGFGLLVFEGLKLTRPEQAAMILALTPVQVALWQWWKTGHRPDRVTLAAIALSGAFRHFRLDPLTGLFLAFAACLGVSQITAGRGVFHVSRYIRGHRQHRLARYQGALPAKPAASESADLGREFAHDVAHIGG